MRSPELQVWIKKGYPGSAAEADVNVAAQRKGQLLHYKVWGSKDYRNPVPQYHQRQLAIVGKSFMWENQHAKMGYKLPTKMKMCYLMHVEWKDI